MNLLKKPQLIILLISSIMITIGCKKDSDAPKEENVVETITDIKLIFTNKANNNEVITARVNDPDGLGLEEPKVLDEITLKKGTEYTLTFEITNNLVDPIENVQDEIIQEDIDHQVFFKFSNNAFSNPTGDGNIDNGSDPINYNDQDDNKNPVGLSTSWTTANTKLSDGKFNIKLQHQPGLKTSTSDANVGDTDIDIEFVLNIE